MAFVEKILSNWRSHPEKAFLYEMHPEGERAFRGAKLLAWTEELRSALRAHGLVAGDRVVFVAANSARWVALDFAILAEGATPVAFYSRQSDAELVSMSQDAAPRLIIVETDAQKQVLSESGVKVVLLESLASSSASDSAYRDGEAPRPANSDAAACIVYTSGTSGDAKGAILTHANIDYMLPFLDHELREMSGREGGSDRVFHYLPLCFAGSRMLLWTCLWRSNPVWLSMSLDRLKDELALAAPEYFLNVPTLLERIRNGVEAKLMSSALPIRLLYARAKKARLSLATGDGTFGDKQALRLTEQLILPKVRKQIGANLSWLICGSAPLAPETQSWFQWLGIPVFQVYGLTETTAIVSIDRVGQSEIGKVGFALPNVQIKLSDESELLVSGPNIFPGYFRREQATREAFTSDGFFKTGDQAEVDERGRISIIGRVKNILVLESGHNVAPEPLESRILSEVTGVEHAVVVGHGRPFLSLLVWGEHLRKDELERSIESVNQSLPHYKRIRRWQLVKEPMTQESGELTANLKLRRKVIEANRSDLLTQIYREPS